MNQMDYQLKMKILDLQEKTRKRKTYFRAGIAIILGLIVFYMIAKLFSNDLPEGNREAVLLLTGSASGAFFGTLISYYFGDSEGRTEHSDSVTEESLSKEKNDENRHLPEEKEVYGK